MVNARQGKWVFGTSFVNIGKVDTKPPFPVCLAHDYRIGQPRRMEHSPDKACRFQLLDLFCDEFLALRCLLPDFLLDGPRMRTDGKVVLNYFPGNTGDVGRLPRKHIDVRPQESNERAFLFRVESGTDGESTTSAVLLGGTFLVAGGAAIAFLHLPVELDGASSTVAQHSEEVRLPEWASELLPDLVFFFPSGASAASDLRFVAAAASR